MAQLGKAIGKSPAKTCWLLPGRDHDSQVGSGLPSLRVLPILLKALPDPWKLLFHCLFSLILVLFLLTKEHLTFCLWSRPNSPYILGTRPTDHYLPWCFTGRGSWLVCPWLAHALLTPSWHFTRAPMDCPSLCFLPSSFYSAPKTMLYWRVRGIKASRVGWQENLKELGKWLMKSFHTLTAYIFSVNLLCVRYRTSHYSL